MTNRLGVQWAIATLVITLLPIGIKPVHAATLTFAESPANAQGVRSQTITQTQSPTAVPLPIASPVVVVVPAVVPTQPIQTVVPATPVKKAVAKSAIAKPVVAKTQTYYNVPVPPQVAPVMSNSIVANAWQLVGSRYRWGGTSPATGFDCTGFVHYVYGARGADLSHVAGVLYSQVVKVGDPQPGDIVFFGRGSVTHVGIYIGEGRIIHASTPSTGVRVDNLAMLSRSLGYVGAGRM